MKKWLTVLPVAALLFIGLIAQAEEKPKVIRYGSVGNAFGKPYAAGTDGVVDVQALLVNEFKNDGVRIERTYYTATGPGLNEAFAAGLLDFGDYGDLPIVVGKAGGLKTKYILPTNKGSNIYIIATPQSKIISVKDLKGKKIAVTKGTYLHLTLNRVLEANGLTEKDVRLVNLSTSDAQNAIAAGSVDAFAGLPDRPLVDQGLAKLIYDTRKDPQKWRGRSGLLVSEDFARKYPELTKRVVKAKIKAAHWASQEKNREALIQLALKTGSGYKVTKEDFAGQDLTVKYSPLADQATINQYKEIVDFAFSRGLIRKKFDVDKWIDKSFAEAALKELGLQNYWTPSTKE